MVVLGVGVVEVVEVVEDGCGEQSDGAEGEGECHVCGGSPEGRSTIHQLQSVMLARRSAVKTTPRRLMERMVLPNVVRVARALRVVLVRFMRCGP